MAVVRLVWSGVLVLWHWLWFPVSRTRLLPSAGDSGAQVVLAGGCGVPGAWCGLSLTFPTPKGCMPLLSLFSQVVNLRLRERDWSNLATGTCWEVQEPECPRVCPTLPSCEFTPMDLCLRSAAVDAKIDVFTWCHLPGWISNQVYISHLMSSLHFAYFCFFIRQEDQNTD